ncbi:hypothetical protein RIF29_28582 [Crotalaria pallida]|uniref:BHLH domain-containing protein n=1 Tax=Crotalaria pallida TaxID=3830 RepID=A0AAN9EDE0_CROPI
MPMGEPSQSWFYDIEMQYDDFFNQCHKIETLDDEDKMFREIMHQPVFTSDSDSHSPITTQNNSPAATVTAAATITDPSHGGNFLMMKSNSSFNSIFSSQHAPQQKPAMATSPTSYILSFDDSTVVAATRQTYAGKRPYHEQQGSGGGGGGALPPSKERYESMEPRVNQAAKKVRSSSETLDHIMAERKRRRELTERFIALSATIPGLKKIDKSTILSEAITHVKQLQQRVKELEEQSKDIGVESVLFIQKSHITSDKGTTSGAMNSNDHHRANEALPTVEARVFKKDVLIRIHCKKQSGIVLKILGHVKSFDLSTISNSVLPFGNSTLDISIIAQMDEKFNVTMNDLVKNLRLALLESPEVQQ